MRTQEQAFRAYYSSMTDSELLAVCRNRSSFIPLAQTLLAEEFLRRHLMPPADTPAETKPPRALFSKLRQWLRRPTPAPSAPAKMEDPVGDVQPDQIASEHAAAAAPGKPMGSPMSHGGSGATKDQVHMTGIVPERVNKQGTKIEDLAGTGQHDSLGG